MSKDMRDSPRADLGFAAYMFDILGSQPLKIETLASSSM